MCGICGFNWEDKELIRRMSSTLAHRGPDGDGCYLDKGISLGHRRLSIIDLSTAGKQPMCNEEGTIWITYNGEIYNFKELRRTLKQKGHQFKSNTDTEVVIHAYEEWREECLQHFNGMFAFCIYDQNKKHLFLARDRLGIKPLYYYWNNNKFIFASEIKAILQHQIVKKINKSAQDHYLTFGFTPLDHSILENIYKLKPGHFLIFKDDLPQIKQYWDLSFNNNLKNKNQIISLIKKNLANSVQKRLIADVPVGAFLSGGIDSSAIVATIKKYKEDLKTFSIGFEYQEFNETEDAKIIAQKLGTEHYENYFNAEDVIKLLPKLTYFYDDPLADYSMLPTYFVSQIAKKHVTVCLGGDGGDELFGGYDWYTQHRLLQTQRIFPKFIRSLAKKTIKAISQSHYSNRITDLINPTNNLSYHNYGKLRSLLNHSDLPLFNIDKDTINTYQEFFKWKKSFNNLMYSDLKLYLPEQILTKVDRASMAHSLEVRVPFLDHNFVEFSSRIPSQFKIRNFQKKYILKKAMENSLPKSTIYKKKKGFGVPLKQYFRKELKSYITENLLKSRIKNKEFTKKILSQHFSRRRDYSHLIWSSLILKEWEKKWIQS